MPRRTAKIRLQFQTTQNWTFWTAFAVPAILGDNSAQRIGDRTLKGWRVVKINTEQLRLR